MASSEAHIHQLESASASVRRALAQPKPWDVAAKAQELAKALKTLQLALQQVRSIRPPKSKVIACGGAYSMLLAVLQSKASAAAGLGLVPLLHELLAFGLQQDLLMPQNLTQTASSAPASPTKYIPPQARSAAPSSDSEASDSEFGGGRGNTRSSRVRFLALACLQLVIKADPKALHPHWASLMPDLDLGAALREKNGTSRGDKPGAPTAIPNAPTLLHLLLLDPSARVRHSAAATLTLLIEGPAQRAYLAIAECRSLKALPVRGFVPLSATLGQVVVGTHLTLLYAVTTERDPSVVSAALRALGTLLVGSPHHRLPPELLPRCVEGVRLQLKQAMAVAHADTRQRDQPVLSACLTCLAGALGAKPPSAALSIYLAELCQGCEGGLAADILKCADPGNSRTVQLDALMALRGLAQQYHAAVVMFWDQILSTARHNVGAVALQSNATSPRGAREDTVAEGVAQQGVLLAGDVLRAASAHIDDELREQCALGEGAWQAAVESCCAACMRHDSPLLRGAAFSAMAGLERGKAARELHAEVRCRVLRDVCEAVESDPVSHVRSAAVRALAALFPDVNDPDGEVSRIH